MLFLGQMLPAGLNHILRASRTERRLRHWGKVYVSRAKGCLQDWKRELMESSTNHPKFNYGGEYRTHRLSVRQDVSDTRTMYRLWQNAGVWKKRSVSFTIRNLSFVFTVFTCEILSISSRKLPATPTVSTQTPRTCIHVDARAHARSPFLNFFISLPVGLCLFLNLPPLVRFAIVQASPRAVPL